MDKNGNVNKNRYFLVHFSGLDSENNLRNGVLCHKTFNDKFLNQRAILDIIENQFKLERPFIKNIMEFTESDFNDWMEGYDNDGLNDNDDGSDFL